MLRFISWGAFWQCLVILVPVYYLVVLVLYFRKDAYGWLKNKGSALKTGSRVPIDGQVEGQINGPTISSVGGSTDNTDGKGIEASIDGSLGYRVEDGSSDLSVSNSNAHRGAGSLKDFDFSILKNNNYGDNV